MTDLEYRSLGRSGLRVSVVGLGGSLREAHDRAYDALSRISFQGAQYRTDIAARELA